MPEEDRIRRYWWADTPFDTFNDGFDRLSALTMLKEIDRLREGVVGLQRQVSELLEELADA